MTTEHFQTTIRAFQKRTSFPRPYWRNYIVAWVLIGVGFMLVGIGAPNPDPAQRRTVLTLAVALFGSGCVIFFCAVGWSLWSTWRSSFRSKPPLDDD